MDVTREEKMASTLMRQAENAIERARRLCARTDSNLDWSECLLGDVEEISSPNAREKRRRMQRESARVV
jgi:hypothetical protein